MRPTKSIKYCYDCGFCKIHFESEEKAMNFIRFNAEEIRKEKGYAPLRTYYCISCGCWHLTSKPAFRYKSRTQKVLEAYKPQKQNKAVCNYTARDWGLTLINDESLIQMAASNIQKIADQKKAIRQREKVLRILKILRKLKADKERPEIEKRWMANRERELYEMEESLNQWVKVGSLPDKCKRFMRCVNSMKLTHSNALIASSYIVRVDNILKKRKEVIDLADEITHSLQDAYSYLQSDMFASVKAKVKDAESALMRIEKIQTNGLSDIMEIWYNTINNYKKIIKSRDFLNEI